MPAAYPDAAPPTAPLFTVEQFAARQPAFTAAALRNMIFKADTRLGSKGKIAGNGLKECGAIVRVGRKVLIDEGRFLEWIRTQSAKGNP
ncbi:MAG: hypothetical protein IH606_23455 [Burkholderiales bacterium]|nr:hypothetical protein [Burkholderiales bacterium]